MHWYKKNIGDYNRKAGKLSLLQHGVYNVLIDSCYDREKFPTMNEAIDWTWASTEAEIEALQFVLGKFFKCVNGVYVQQHIFEDLQRYKGVCMANSVTATNREKKKRSVAGRARTGTKRSKKSTSRAKNTTKREHTVHESSPKPVTSNQEPVTSNHILKNLQKEELLKKDFWDDSFAVFNCWLEAAGYELGPDGEPLAHDVEFTRHESLAVMTLLDANCPMHIVMEIIRGEVEDANRTNLKQPTLGEICTKTINEQCNNDFKSGFESMIQELIYNFAPLTE